jgi:hypothetical protein
VATVFLFGGLEARDDIHLNRVARKGGFIATPGNSRFAYEGELDFIHFDPRRKSEASHAR